MSEPSLVDKIKSLSPEEQNAVREFIDFLKKRPKSPFLAAVDEFVAEHPDLVRRLAR